MKNGINKSAKRVLSLALAVIMFAGTLFVANSGVQIIAGAATAPIEEGTIDLLEFGDYLINDLGSTSKWYDTKLADNGETGADWDDAIIIDSAEEFVYLAKASGNDTDGKYYKVADGIAGFDLSKGNLDLDGTLADNIDKIKAGGKNHAGGTPGFQGHFDGNNAVVYGAWSNHNSGNVSPYAGLFSCVQGEVSIKNIHVKLASFTATNSAAGIVAYYKGEGDYTNNTTLTIENCSVTDSHLEVTNKDTGYAVAAVVGKVVVPSGYTDTNDEDKDGNTTDTVYVNNKINVNNCYVNLDEAYVTSAREDDSEVNGVYHGGVVGYAGTNAVMVSNCVVIGITPYPTTENTSENQIQHTGHANNFSNVYTDQAVSDNIYVGGTTKGGSSGKVGYQNLTGVMTQLTPAQMQGSAAISNMALDWFSAWIPGEEGEYPQLVPQGYVSTIDFWDGTGTTEYAGGTGTEDDPFIIKTAEQLYGALSTTTYTTSKEGDLAVETAEDVAGGTQTDRMYKQSSTTVYVPVYTPYYYKVDDSVKSFYLNNIYGNETLDGAKAMGASSTKKDWKPGKSFVGHLDGNGVTIYGLYSSTGQGLIYKLDGTADVRNIHFNAGYSTAEGGSAFLTTFLGSYANDSTIVNVSNVSVRNSYSATTRNATVSDTGTHNPGAAAIISTGSTCENITLNNCFVDAYSCEIVQGSGSTGVLADGYVSYMGAIYSGGSSANNFTLTGCVSLGAPAVDELYVPGKEVNYTRYDKNQGFQVFFYNNYTDYPSTYANTYSGKYEKLNDITRIAKLTTYQKFDMPKLAWYNWEFIETADGRTIPMPTVTTSTTQSIGSYMQIIGQGQNKYPSSGPYLYGTNPYTLTLEGAGTEENPYLIENGEQLARAIATGGMNLYDQLYYKLVADIDLSAGAWINQEQRLEGGIYYRYIPFGGTLDGNGHTITGMSAGDDKSAGLIPVLTSTGVVKNLHVRNSSAISLETAGIIAGEVETGAQIIGCSVENCTVESKNGTNVISGTKTGWDTVYYINGTDEYYLADGTEYNATNYKNIFNVEANKDDWYIGGKEGSRPKLKSQGSQNGSALDIAGDGVADGYGAADLTALRNKLLRKADYANVNGDVSRNGIINIADLAVLQRIIVGAYGTDISDTFFANVAEGNIRIYYGENDNYDAARKVELYLENLFGIDVQKCVSTTVGTVSGADSDKGKVYLHAGDEAENPDGTLDVIVGDVVGYTADLDSNQYEVTYDKANKLVWLKGENFTAVEQAVLNFVAGSKVDGDLVYTCAATELEDYKKPITVKLDTDFDGTIDTNKTLYYTWGDEFNGENVDTNYWTNQSQQSEGQQGETDSSYNNQEIAPVKELNKVLVVKDGKLSMKRGFRKGTNGYTEDINGVIALDIEKDYTEDGVDYAYNGYDGQDDNPAIGDDDNYFSSGKLITDRGMLFKQGYIEFEGQLPADGHAFPAWWLMGRPSGAQNNLSYDNSLYSKIYKLNSKWNGTNTWDEDNLDTYKYQVPTAVYEIDMIEVMQHSDRHYIKKENTGFLASGSYHNTDYKSYRGAVYYNMINSTIHKWWNNGVDNQDDDNASNDRLHIIDWDKYTVSSGITNSDFSTTSSAGSWIHNIGSTTLDFGTPTEEGGSGWSKYTYYDTYNFNQEGHDNLTAKRRYGFSWYTDGVSRFEATLYVYNTDGTLMTTVPIASGMSSLNKFLDGNKEAETSGAIGDTDSGAFADVYSDAKVFNQYMYILFDNKYYSSNDNISGTNTNNIFTDLLTSQGLKSFEIDYVRVYQQDGQRDIVTKETQSFNNNNHFGY